jgi:hypothetical protein
MLLVPARCTIDVQLIYIQTEKMEEKQDVLAVYASGQNTGIADKVWAGESIQESVTLTPAVGKQGYGKLLTSPGSKNALRYGLGREDLVALWTTLPVPVAGTH